jgi:hypothetical protein
VTGGRACRVPGARRGEHGRVAETPVGPQAEPRENAPDGEAPEYEYEYEDEYADEDGDEHDAEYGDEYSDEHDAEYDGEDGDEYGDEPEPGPEPDEPSGRRAGLLDIVAELRDRLVRHGPDLLIGALIGFGVAAAVWLVGAALVLGIWAFSAPQGSQVAGPLHFTGQLWLAAHHVRLRTPDGTFRLTPLGFTLLPAAAFYLLGRANATPPTRLGDNGDDPGEAEDHDRATDPTSPFRRLAAVAVCYPVAALAILSTADEPGLRADPAAAIGWPFLLAACCFGAGLCTAGRLVRLGVRAVAALRAAGASFATLLGGAALLAAVALAAALHQATVVNDRIAPDSAGTLGLFLIQAALVPNLAIWALGFAAGPGFAVGAGSRIAATTVVHGPLPGVPVLQAVPAPGTPSSWYLLVFAVPVAAAVVLVLLVGRALPGARDRLATAAVAAVLAGSSVGLAAALSGGPVAAGAESVTGPAPGWTGLAVAAELGVLAAAGIGIWTAADRFRRRPRTVQLRSGSPMAVPCEREHEPVVPLEVTHTAAFDTAATAAPSAEPALDRAPALPEAAPDSVVPDDQRAADLVGEGLALLVPERPEVADVAGHAVEDMGEVVPDGEAEADRLAGGLAHEADAGDLLAGGGAGVALQVHQVDADADADQGAEPDEGGVGAAADGPGVGVDGDGAAGGGGQDDAEDPPGGHDQAVDDEA